MRKLSIENHYEKIVNRESLLCFQSLEKSRNNLSALEECTGGVIKLKHDKKSNKKSCTKICSHGRKAKCLNLRSKNMQCHRVKNLLNLCHFSCWLTQSWWRQTVLICVDMACQPMKSSVARLGTRWQCSMEAQDLMHHLNQS